MAEEVQNKTQLDHVIYSRDVVHSYSPGIQKLLNLCIDYIPYCNRQFKEGKNVVWSIALGADPTICYGSGFIPASITEIGRLGAAEAVATAENYFQVPNETCAMVKSDLGEFYLRRGEISNRLYYASKDCEPYNEAFELLKDYGYDIHVMDVGFRPAGANSDRIMEMRKHYKNEIVKTIQWMTGKEPDLEELRRQQIYYNKIQKKIRTLLNLRAYHPTYMGSLPTMLLLMANNHFFGRPQEYEAMLDEIIEELSVLKPDEYNNARALLAWSGARGQEFNIFEAIDEAGGAILTWQIPNNIVHEFNLALDPLDACVEFELGDLISGTTEQACQKILESMRQYNAKGIILYGYLGCSFATIDIELKRKYFKNHNIQGLSLIGSFDVGTVTGQVTTRVRAFIEMLEKKQQEEIA
jgi:benzoyl-CoA reductase/2-hydroxyglutaryl-CoA dehydratase subunit BcrC/BadD/HgdB